MTERTPEFYKQVARLASQYCKSQGIKHQEIADALNLSKSQVDNWFCTGRFTAKGIRVLNEHFKVPMEIFTEGSYNAKILSSEAFGKLLIRMQLKIEDLEERVSALEKNDPHRQWRWFVGNQSYGGESPRCEVLQMYVDINFYHNTKDNFTNWPIMLKKVQNEKVHYAVKQALKRKGITGKKAAEMLGVSPKTVYNNLYISNFSEEMASRWSSVLDIPLETFFEGTPPVPPEDFDSIKKDIRELKEEMKKLKQDIAKLKEQFASNVASTF